MFNTITSSDFACTVNCKNLNFRVKMFKKHIIARVNQIQWNKNCSCCFRLQLVRKKCELPVAVESLVFRRVVCRRFITKVVWCLLALHWYYRGHDVWFSFKPDFFFFNCFLFVTTKDACITAMILHVKKTFFRSSNDMIFHIFSSNSRQHCFSRKMTAYRLEVT